MKRTLTIMTMLLMLCLALAGCGDKQTTGDQLEYEGKTYVPVTFNQDVFSCSFSMEGNFEEDVTYPVESNLFDMVHNSGDLYVEEDQAGEAANYYQDDANYDWQISIFSEEGDDAASPIQITAEELDYIYAMEEQEQDLAIFFDEIEQQATLIKTSKDGVACGSIELALYDGQWYWRSEIIDENQEKDGTWPEYIQPMPETFQDKIKL